MPKVSTTHREPVGKQNITYNIPANVHGLVLSVKWFFISDIIGLPNVIFIYDHDGADGVWCLSHLPFYRCGEFRLRSSIVADVFLPHVRFAGPQDKSLQFHAKSKQNESI